ncbi:hypothetical protein [Streptomyces sp. NPDC127072]
MAEARRLCASCGFTERPPYEGPEIPADVRRLWHFYELHRG